MTWSYRKWKTFYQNCIREELIVWRTESCGCGLKMKSLVLSLYTTLVGDGIEDFPSKEILNPHASTKVGIFSWEAAWDKILTQDKL